MAAATYSPIGTPLVRSPGTSTNPAPRITGVASRNENRAASWWRRPAIRPPPMVTPEREMPGMKASAWHAPTMAAARKLMRSADAKCASCSVRDAPRSVRRRRNSKPSMSRPLTIRKPAATYGLANNDLILLSRKTPRMAAGMVPTSSSMARRSESLRIRPAIAAVKNPRTSATHCCRYRTSSAVAVPRWRRTRNGTNDGSDCLKDQWRRLGTSTAWPSDETGNSSLAPCSRPMNNACARVTGLYSRSGGSTRSVQSGGENARRIDRAGQGGGEAWLRIGVDDADARRSRRRARARGVRPRHRAREARHGCAADLHPPPDGDGADGGHARRALPRPLHPRHRHQPQGHRGGDVGPEARRSGRRDARVPDHRALDPARRRNQRRRRPIHRAQRLLPAARRRPPD